jgi:hypothetical protein
MKCYLPRVHYLSKAEFESIGTRVTAENVPVWVDSSNTNTGPAESQLASIFVSSNLNATLVNAGLNIKDGNLNTAWSSAFGQPEATAIIDLGSVKTISALKLYWDALFFGKNYSIQISNDNANYTTVASMDNGNGGVDLYKNLQNVKGRYVKLNLSSFNLAYYRLREFEVYTSDCNCMAPLLSATKFQTSQNGQIKLFPNPTRDFVTIQSSLTGRQILSIYNAQGRLMLEKTTTDNPATLNVAALPAGTYSVIASGQQQRLVQRFIKLK